MNRRKNRFGPFVSLLFVMLFCGATYAQNSKIPLQGKYYVLSDGPISVYQVNKNKVTAFKDNQAVQHFTLTKVEEGTYFFREDNGGIYPTKILALPDGNYKLTIQTPEKKQEQIVLSKRKPIPGATMYKAKKLSNSKNATPLKKTH